MRGSIGTTHIERIVFMATLFIHRIFGIEGQTMQVRQHPENRFTGARFQPVQATLQ